MDTSWFIKETELATANGVSHPENMPFLLRPSHPNGQAVILVHGFCSTPREMRALGELLYQHNFVVYGARLPGHGTTPDDLARQRVENWQTTIGDGYSALARQGYKVSAAGISTGSLLTLDLALHANLEKIVLLAPFLKLHHWLAEHVAFLSRFIQYQKKKIPTEDLDFHYNLRPLKGVVQINRLRWKLKNELSHIVTPTLILASTGDKTIAPGTAQKIYAGLASHNKQIHLYGDNVPHSLATEHNPYQQDVLKRCLEFLTDGTA